MRTSALFIVSRKNVDNSVVAGTEGTRFFYALVLNMLYPDLDTV